MAEAFLNRRLFIASTGAVLASCASKAAPVDRVHFLIAFAPGASFDKTCRAAQAALVEKGLVKNATAENLVGEGGGTAFARLLNRSVDNSNTLMLFGTSGIARNTLGLFPYKHSDLTVINRFSAEPLTFSVKSDSRFQSFSEVVTAIKANPSAVRFCSDSAVGLSEHLCAAKMLSRAGVAPNSVPYFQKSGSKAHIAAVLKGEVEVVVAASADVLAHQRDRSLRVLATSSDKRVVQLPEVPTLAEVGIPDAVFYNARGFFMAPDINAEKVRTMGDTLAQMVSSQEWERERVKAEVTMLFAPGPEARTYFATQEREVRVLQTALGIIK